MTDWTSWFQDQLQASADGLLWGFSQINPTLLDKLPPDPGYLGTWPPLRHLWHISEYERCLALPAMQMWVENMEPVDEDWPDDDAAWAAVQDKSPQTLCANFIKVRQKQIALLKQFSTADWEHIRETGWGEKPLSFIVTKTFQHTYEHGDTLLRMSLWWEHILAEIAQSQSNHPDKG